MTHSTGTVHGLLFLPDDIADPPGQGPREVGSPSAGILNSVAFGVDQVVVTMKKVIKRKPRSTMGVRSTRGDSFLLCRTAALR